MNLNRLKGIRSLEKVRKKLVSLHFVKIINKNTKEISFNEF
jgi:hypothetical protein